MKSTIQKKLAAKLTKRSPKKIALDPARLEDIKEAITRQDVKLLLDEGAIKVKQDKGVSRVRAKKIQAQKAKGRRKGQGSRKGTSNARLSDKTKWMNKIRAQRELLKSLKASNHINQETYKELYRKAKGGFFRSRRHIKLYISEKNLIQNGK